MTVKNQGLISFGGLPIEGDKAPATVATLTAGRWCLHTTSTIPFVAIQSGGTARTVTWGDVIDVETNGQIINASAHVGDVTFAPVLDGIVSRAPAQLVIPVTWTTVEIAEIAWYQTQWLDVRGARRAYLSPNLSDVSAMPTPFTVEHRNAAAYLAPPIKTSLPTGGNAQTTGLIEEVRTIEQTSKYGLGYRTRDTSPGDPTPHTLLAAVRFRISSEVADSSLLPLSDAMFQVEY